MRLPKSFPLDPRLARDGALDKDVLVGFLKTGTYHLPSCSTDPAPGEECVAFATRAQARLAGQVPCKVCRPDKVHDLADDHIETFAALSRVVQASPHICTGVPDLARSADM